VIIIKVTEVQFQLLTTQSPQINYLPLHFHKKNSPSTTISIKGDLATIYKPAWDCGRPVCSLARWWRCRMPWFVAWWAIGSQTLACIDATPSMCHRDCPRGGKNKTQCFRYCYCGITHLLKPKLFYYEILINIDHLTVAFSYYL